MQTPTPDPSSTTSAGNTSGFIPRNHPSLIIVPDWAEFEAWARDAGYDESYFDVNDSKCMELQRVFLEEQRDALANTDGAEAG